MVQPGPRPQQPLKEPPSRSRYSRNACYSAQCSRVLGLHEHELTGPTHLCPVGMGTGAWEGWLPLALFMDGQIPGLTLRAVSLLLRNVCC